jgi:hypothetical protein
MQADDDVPNGGMHRELPPWRRGGDVDLIVNRRDERRF